MHVDGRLQCICSSQDVCRQMCPCLSALRFNSAEALVYVGGPTAVLLLLGAVIWEDMGPGSKGWALLAVAPGPFLLAFTMSFLVNLSCFFAIQNTSSLTFKVSPVRPCVTWIYSEEKNTELPWMSLHSPALMPPPQRPPIPGKVAGRLKGRFDSTGWHLS